jgi:hypothetical protein
MSVLYVKNNGVWEPITTIKGDPGEVTQEEFEQLYGEVAEIEANKADTDLSNLTEEGEDKLKQLSFPYVGQTIFSLDPLIEDTLHLLDGTLLPVGGIYDQFVTEYIANLYTTHPQRFCTETEWQNSVSTYGVCGKYVYNAGVSVRLPKVTGFVEGTIDANVLGEITEAGLPTLTTNSTGAHTHTRGTMNITGNTAYVLYKSGYTASGAFTLGTEGGANDLNTGGSKSYTLNFDASKNWTGATSSAGAHTHTISGTSDTVQPQSIKGFIYIVVATGSKTDIEVDLDKYTTDLNSLAADKVSKSGDTMTGSLRLRNNNQTAGTTPSANMAQGVFFYDKNSLLLGYLQNEYRTNGTRQTMLNCRNADGSASTSLSIGFGGDGKVFCDFPKCTTKATTTSTANNTLVAVVVQNYLSGKSWYRVWSDGWIEQGGLCNSEASVTYLKAFSNDNYTLVASGVTASSNSTQYRQLMPTARSATGFTGTTNSGIALFWYACGY